MKKPVPITTVPCTLASDPSSGLRRLVKAPSRSTFFSQRGPGYHDRWAYPVDASVFTLLSDPGKTFHDFCTFCKIESPPPVQGVII